MTYDDAIQRAADQASDGHLLRLGMSAHQVISLRSVTPEKRTEIISKFIRQEIFRNLP